jgi:YD repeat-containing protein
MTYDALGNMTASTNALGEQAFRAFYDLNGNVTNRVDGAGNTIRSAYDQLNRLTNTTATVGASVPASPAGTSRFTYDVVGNMLTASNATAQLTFAYDTMNRLTNAIVRANNYSPLPAFTNRWHRDLGGLVTNLTYTTGKSVAYTHDEDGLLSSVKDWQGNTWTFTRDAAGRLTMLGAPNTSSAFTYDDANRLTSWNVGTIAGRQITYDAANRRIKDEITHGAIPKPQLQRTAQNTFDAADKLISSSVRYGQGTDSTPHITETFLYDGNGALTNWVSSTNSLSLAYNALGQVASITNHLSLTINHYSYDALGNRISTGDRVWVPNHSDALKRPLLECDNNGVIIRYYIWGENRLLGFIENNTLTVAHCDNFGSVIALTDTNGNILYSANYGPHGEDWGSTGVNPTPFTW